MTFLKDAMDLFKEQVLGSAKHEIFTDRFDQDYIKVGNSYSLVTEKLDRQNSLSLSTLNGVVDYINEVIDENISEPVIQIVSPKVVRIYNELDSRMVRNQLIESEPVIPSFPFSNMMDRETFMVNVQSKFLPSDDLTYLLDLISHIKIEDGVNIEDTGVNQKVATQNGIELKIEAVKPRLLLFPIRTFIEVDQPESEFVFRMQEVRGEVVCGLFPADGELWRITAMASIKEWIKENLSDDSAARTKILM